MPEQFEISVPLPPAAVMQRLESARKEMAPRIGTCTAVSDKQSFVCRVDYANAYALLKAQATGDGKETNVFVETHGSTIFMKPFGIAVVLLVLFGIAFIMHPNGPKDWVWLILGSLLYPTGSLLLVPLSKRVLSRFIRDTLLDNRTIRKEMDANQ